MTKFDAYYRFTIDSKTHLNMESFSVTHLPASGCIETFTKTGCYSDAYMMNMVHAMLLTCLYDLFFSHWPLWTARPFFIFSDGQKVSLFLNVGEKRCFTHWFHLLNYVIVLMTLHYHQFGLLVLFRYHNASLLGFYSGSVNLFEGHWRHESSQSFRPADRILRYLSFYRVNTIVTGAASCSL